MEFHWLSEQSQASSAQGSDVRTNMQAFVPAGPAPSESAQRVSLEVRAKTDQWMGLRKLLAALADPSLQERHWVAIAEAVGFEVRPDESTTLRRLIEYGIQDHILVSPYPCSACLLQTFHQLIKVQVDGSPPPGLHIEIQECIVMHKVLCSSHDKLSLLCTGELLVHV